MAGLAAWLVRVLAPVVLAATSITAVPAIAAARPSPEPALPDDILPDDSIRLSTLGTNEGLSQSSITAMAQDEYGFIWLGTADGLNRFDGHDTLVIRRGERGLSRDSVHSLCTDDRGGLWIGLFDGGLHRYDTHLGEMGAVRPGDGSDNGPLPGRVSACLSEPNGAVWFATDTGLSRYDPQRDRFQHWPVSAGNDTETARRLLALQRAPNGDLLALSSQGIYRLHDNRLQLEPGPNALSARSRLTSFWVDGDSILIGTQQAGLWRWQPDSGLLAPVDWPRFAVQPQITSLLRDRDGRLWIGSENLGVIYQVQPGARWQQLLHRPGHVDGLPDNHVRTLFQSREGVIWIGTWLGGVSRFDPLQSSFHVVRTDPIRADSLASNSVRSLLAEADQLWIGTDGGGLSLSRDNGRRYQHFQNDPADPNSLSDNHVRLIHRDRKGRLWVGTENGLNEFNGQRFRRILLPATPDGSEDHQRLRALAEAADGSLWLGTFGGGLLRFYPGANRFESFRAERGNDNSLCGNRVVALLRDSDDSLLIGTDDGGLCRRYPDGRFERLLPAVFSVWSLHSSDDAIWVGSYGDGLLKLHRRSKRIYRFDDRHGIHNDVIYAILPDASNRFWLSTNDGLFRFDPAQEKADAYTVSAGLQDREFNSGAAAKGPDGRLYFGGIRGFNWFDPAAVALNMTPPRSTITNVLVMQQNTRLPMHASDRLALSAGQNTLLITFSGQHFSNPEGNRYRYRLLPVETEWNEISAGQHQANYSLLAPGDYQFELRAGSAAGVWDPEPRRLAILIAPPFWASTGAYLLYAISAGIMLFALLLQHRRRRQQEKDLLQTLQQQVETRTHELQEKNATLEQLNSELQQVNGRLETMSLTDPLTGLGNRRLLFRYLEKDAPAVLRRHQDAANQLQVVHQSDLLFFLIDLDHFKRINDSFGHAVGDEVLLAVKDRLQQICREQDFLVRYGGEEFLLVSRYSERSISPQLAERIRSVISDQPLTLKNGSRLSISCSIGYAAFPLHLDMVNAYTCEQVLQVADCLLYAAKHSGRNHWVGATSARESRAELLLTRLRENGAIAVSNGDIDLQTSLRSSKKLRWQALDGHDYDEPFGI
ncbi:MAG TPA: two-component regulator propeller domain-containing protein [Permianibacter sp.]|nr:two-component regulator propeller domain-containing protein [Permianibacter sp.]